MVAKLHLARGSARRKFAPATKVTFESFEFCFSYEPLGERAEVLVEARGTPSKPNTKRTKVVLVSLLALFVLFAAVTALIHLNSGVSDPGATVAPPPIDSESKCEYSLEATSLESRTSSNFGGVKVDSGRLECDGAAFIITQTSNSAGEIVSVKKKWA